MNLFIVPKNAQLSQEFLCQKLGTNFLNVDVESWLNFNAIIVFINEIKDLCQVSEANISIKGL